MENSDKVANVFSVSGGKDSTALLLLGIERGVDPIAVFADTGHEHVLTYRYIEYLNKEVWPIRVIRADFSDNLAVRRKNLRTLWERDGIPEARIRKALQNLYPTGNPFLDLCKLKGRFPSSRARFCSEELKHLPIEKEIFIPLLREGRDVVSWQGVRADESRARASLPEKEWADPGITIYRPLLRWSAEQVFDLHRKHGVKPNPLYLLGMSRVGCMPCIHARKSEIAEIARRWPEEIGRVEEWEEIVSSCSKRGTSTFFAQDKTPEGRRHKGENWAPGIRSVVEWATCAGQGEMFVGETSMCSSVYGLCE